MFFAEYFHNLSPPYPPRKLFLFVVTKMAADLSPTDKETLEALLQVSSKYFVLFTSYITKNITLFRSKLRKWQMAYNYCMLLSNTKTCYLSSICEEQTLHSNLRVLCIPVAMCVYHALVAFLENHIYLSMILGKKLR